MRAAVVHAWGEAPRCASFAEPEALAGEEILEVRAAGIHPLVKLLASGKHYGSGGTLPIVAGVDAVGVTPDGRRVYGGFPRSPFGTMAERVAVPRSLVVPVPDGVDDAVAAAAANPAMSAWLALVWRAELTPGQTVLVLGATGVAGRMAVQLAKHLGAGRVIAAGREPALLEQLPALGADRVVSLDADVPTLAARLREAAGAEGIDAIVDYVWGSPAEAAIEAIARRGLAHAARRVRLVQVGESAGRTITLPAAVLRSSALEITGTGAGTVALETIVEAIPRALTLLAEGVLTLDVERVALADVEQAWPRPAKGRRIVVVP